MWLESVLSKFKRILLMVSHSQDFMNGVCTNIIHLHQRQLNYYAGELKTLAYGLERIPQTAISRELCIRNVPTELSSQATLTRS